MSGQTLKSQADGECVGPEGGGGTAAGGGEVLRALYDFKATIEQTLDFARHDIFILHSSSNKQKNWWHVINAHGKVGYIPSNYVETVPVSSNYLVSFISKCMQSIERSLPPSESGGGKRHQLLKELAERKRRAEGGMRSPIPPRPPTRGATPTSCPASPFASSATAVHKDDHCGTPTKTLKKSATVGQSISASVKQPEVEEVAAAEADVSANDSAPDLPAANKEEADVSLETNQEEAQPETTKQEDFEPEPVNEAEAMPSQSCNDKEDDKTDAITAEDTYRLVQKVRFHTELSYEMSRVAVGVVVSNLMQLLSSSAHAPLETLLCHLRGSGEGGAESTAAAHLLDESHDAERLGVVVGELVACKEDAQQRSWELYEDEDAIIEYLAEFTDIVKKADPAISCRVLSRDKCWQLESLVAYYQMEVRWTIRSQLLDAFLAVCALHRTFLLLFLNSVLPVELARDMQTNVKDIPKLINSAKLLTVILSMGEPMPIPHLEQLGEEFVDFLLSLIEEPPQGNEQISEEFFVVLVSYNLQFVPQSSNIVVEALAKRTSATNFTEKLLFMLNREDDPVRAITQQKKYANSVLKLIVDIFVSRKAANLFYTNDINVLIDIIVRQLTDLSPGDEKRWQYLQLCRQVLRNTDYGSSQHRCDDLHKCFIHIFCEETEASRLDQALVRDISNEFPHYFKT